MTKRKIVYLQGVDDDAYLLPAEDHRLYQAALWTPEPGQDPLRARAGIVAGPTNPARVFAVAGGVNVDPGTVIVQGTVTGVQGVYGCTWDATEFLATPPASDTTYRRFIVIARVYDRLNLAATDGWDLEVLLGAGASSEALAASPALPANCVELRRGVVAPSGAVSINDTPGDLTVPRGGVLPVAADDSRPGAYPGHVRWKPYGMQVWSGTNWMPSGHVAMSATARRALVTAGMPRGTMVYELDTDQLLRWNGTAWRLVSPNIWSTTGGSSMGWASTVYKWVPALGPWQQIPADRIVRGWHATVSANINREAWMRLRVDLAAGDGKPASTSYYPSLTGEKCADTETTVNFGGADVLLGDQAASFYLEAKATVSGEPDVHRPHLQLAAY